MAERFVGKYTTSGAGALERNQGYCLMSERGGETDT